MPNGPPEGFTESPSGMHWIDREGGRVPKPEETTAPTITSSWLSRPVSIPWPVLIALLGLGGGGVGFGFISKDDVVTKEEFTVWTQKHAELHNGLSNDIEDVADDLEDVAEDLKEIDKFFKKVPDFGDP